MQRSKCDRTNPLGLLADTELRQHFDLVQVVDYDWMHSCLQDGTLSVEIYLCCKPARELALRVLISKPT